MLYATTRSDVDTYTAQRALKEKRSPDGGFYIPMQLPELNREELFSLLSGSQGEILAWFMNRFFAAKLTARDVEFALGKGVIRIHTMSHRITAAEGWHNPDGDFSRVCRVMAQRLAVDKTSVNTGGEWLRLVCRMAALFIGYSEMLRQNVIHFGTKVDITYPVATFGAPMAAWYARKMGLPIGSIICCCNENNSLWELLNRGEMKSYIPVRKTNTPRCDVSCPEGVERLIRETPGLGASLRFAQALESRGTYAPGPDRLRLLQGGFYVCVVSDKRISRVIANVWASHSYVLCPYTALAHSGLMDFRAETGSGNPALMVCESSPLQCEDLVSQALGITGSQLHERLGVTV